MGDYGEQYGPESLPYDVKVHSKPLHKIDLNSRKGEHWRERNIAPETPAQVDWYEAEKYCHWLGTVTDLPFALPTESPWEYDSRSRGEFVIAPTNDGAIQI